MTCPLCSSSHCAVKYNLDPSLLRQAWQSYLPALDAETTNFKTLTLWKCTNCDLEFFSPPSPGNAAFYERLNKAFSDYYPQQKWEYQIALEKILSVKCRTVLELGCGDGTFLKMVRQSGLDATGIDFNAHAENQDNLKIIEADLSDYKTSEQFDCIAAFQVLEHMARPAEFLANIVTMLKPGGLLILAVPNQNGMYSYLAEKDKALDMPPHHMTRWSQKALNFIGHHYDYDLLANVAEPLSYEHFRLIMRCQPNFLSSTNVSFQSRLLRKLSTVFQEGLMPFFYFMLKEKMAGHTSLVIFSKRSS